MKIKTTLFAVCCLLLLISVLDCSKSDGPTSPPEPTTSKGFDPSMAWKRVSQPPGASVRGRLASLGNVLYAGFYRGGVYRSTDYGTSWAQINNGMVNSFIYSLGVIGSTLLAGTNGAGAYISVDSGTTWTTTGLEHTNVNAFAVVGPYLLAAANQTDNSIFGVYVSTDSGRMWHAGNVGLSPYLVPMYDVLNCFAVSGANLFLGSTKGVFFSTNAATSWIQASDGLNNLEITALAPLESILFAGSPSGVFRSTNNSQSWISSGFSNQYVTAVTIVDKSVIVAASGALYISFDNGITWTHADKGIEGDAVFSFAVLGRTLFAGTWNSVWSHPLEN